MRLDYERLAAALKSRHRLSRPLEGRTPSGVMIPIYDLDGGTQVLFTLRTHKVKHHKGQISFPGGAAEEVDGTIYETAIRETSEEVGIPLSHMHVLGAADDILTISGFHVTPVVVRIDWPFPTEVCQDEIQQLIEVPIKDLLSPGTPRVEMWEWDGNPVEMYFYDYGEYVIWGATGRILKQFLEVAAECITAP